MKQKDKSINELAQGLQAMISKYRCSFTDEELVLLKECIAQLETAKAEKDEGKMWERGLVTLKILANVFSHIDHFKDLF